MRGRRSGPESPREEEVACVLSDEVESGGESDAVTVDDEESAEPTSNAGIALRLRTGGSTSSIGGSGARLGSHSPLAYERRNVGQSSSPSGGGPA